MRMSLTMKKRENVFHVTAVFAILLACSASLGCNRAGARIPGASMSFPDTPTRYKAIQPISSTATVLMPTDARPLYYGTTIAGTDWTACSTDPFWTNSAPSIVRDRLTKELESAQLFKQISHGPPARGDVVIRSEIRAFCSQAVGFLILTIAGISSIHLEVEQNGKQILARTFERVVTDDDPQFTGSQIGMIEQGMVTSMGDSLRELLRDILQHLDKTLPR